MWHLINKRTERPGAEASRIVLPVYDFRKYVYLDCLIKSLICNRCDPETVQCRCIDEPRYTLLYTRVYQGYV